MRRSLPILTVPVLAVATAALSAIPSYAMRIDVPGDRARSCLDSQSPLIRLSNVPDGTASLKVRIVKADDWTDIPAVAVIPYRGVDRIDKGAIRYFVRCPAGPFGKGATIEVRVQARDANDRVIATSRDNAYYPAP